MKHLAITLMLVSSINLFGQIHQIKVRNFTEISAELLGNIEKMGVDDSYILNEYEGRYLNFIFKIDSQKFNLVGKRVGFLGNKRAYFKEERERFNNNSTTINATLYIFDAAQKAESGGYDGAIVYWSKFVVPIEKVVAKFKKQR